MNADSVIDLPFPAISCLGIKVRLCNAEVCFWHRSWFVYWLIRAFTSAIV